MYIKRWKESTGLIIFNKKLYKKLFSLSIRLNTKTYKIIKMAFQKVYRVGIQDDRNLTVNKT